MIAKRRAASHAAKPQLEWKVFWLAFIVLTFGACTYPPGPKQVKQDNAVEVGVRVSEPVHFSERKSKISFNAPADRLEIVYMDLGDSVGLILRSPVNVVILADTDNELPTPPKDRIYAADLTLSKSACSALMNRKGRDASSRRGLRQRSACGRSDHRRISFRYSFRIPKRELLGDSGKGLVAFATFDPATAAREHCFPGGASAALNSNCLKKEFGLCPQILPIAMCRPAGRICPTCPLCKRPMQRQRARLSLATGSATRLKLTRNQSSGERNEPVLGCSIGCPQGGSANRFPQCSSPKDVAPEQDQTFSLRVQERTEHGTGDLLQSMFETSKL